MCLGSTTEVPWGLTCVQVQLKRSVWLLWSQIMFNKQHQNASCWFPTNQEQGKQGIQKGFESILVGWRWASPCDTGNKKEPGVNQPKVGTITLAPRDQKRQCSAHQTDLCIHGSTSFNHNLCSWIGLPSGESPFDDSWEIARLLVFLGHLLKHSFFTFQKRRRVQLSACIY